MKRDCLNLQAPRLTVSARNPFFLSLFIDVIAGGVKIIFLKREKGFAFKPLTLLRNVLLYLITVSNCITIRVRILWLFI